MLGFAGLFWWMLEYAVQLRRRLTPNVKLSFVSGAGGLSRTKQQLYDSKTAEPMGKTDAVYVRIKVESLSEIGPKVCAPFLVRLERLGATEPQIADLHDGLQLPWAFNGVAGLPVHFKVPRFIDVLVVGERIQGLALPIPSPNSLGDFLETPGTFLVDVNVVADGVTKPIRLKVVWTGDWRTIHAEEIASQ